MHTTTTRHTVDQDTTRAHNSIEINSIYKMQYSADIVYCNWDGIHYNYNGILLWVLLGYPALPSAISRGWWLMQGWGHLRSIFLPGFHYLSSISFGAGFSYFSTFGFSSHCEIQRSSLMNAVFGRLLTFQCV